MHSPLQIVFSDIPPSPAIEDAVRKEAEQLERYSNRITGCHVTIATPHRHHHRGQLYSVRIDIVVPGEELIINREHHLHHSHEDAYLAIREAFHAARRELEDYVRRMRGQVKHHESRPHGRVARVFPSDHYGFIAADDGHEVYFHRNSVLQGGFDRLRAGDEVRFVESAGEKGPNATSVRLCHPHRQHG